MCPSSLYCACWICRKFGHLFFIVLDMQEVRSSSFYCAEYARNAAISSFYCARYAENAANFLPCAGYAGNVAIFSLLCRKCGHLLFIVLDIVYRNVAIFSLLC